MPRNPKKVKGKPEVIKKERGSLLSLFQWSSLLAGGGFDLVQIMAVVGHAGLAHPVGQTESTALGAHVDAGGIQLPYGAATLVPTLLGHFTLGYCHFRHLLQC